MAVAAAQTSEGIDMIDAATILDIWLARPDWHAAACRGHGQPYE